MNPPEVRLFFPPSCTGNLSRRRRWRSQQRERRCTTSEVNASLVHRVTGIKRRRKVRAYPEFRNSHTCSPHVREIEPSDIETHHRMQRVFWVGVETVLRRRAGCWMSLRCHKPRPHLLAESRANSPQFARSRHNNVDRQATWVFGRDPNIAASGSTGEAVLPLGGNP